jgi:hypothetical protein
MKILFIFVWIILLAGCANPNGTDSGFFFSKNGNLMYRSKEEDQKKEIGYGDADYWNSKGYTVNFVSESQEQAEKSREDILKLYQEIDNRKREFEREFKRRERDKYLPLFNSPIIQETIEYLYYIQTSLYTQRNGIAYPSFSQCNATLARCVKCSPTTYVMTVDVQEMQYETRFVFLITFAVNADGRISIVSTVRY